VDAVAVAEQVRLQFFVCEAPSAAGAAGFNAGLFKGIAGTMRPLLGALEA
jgi:hypothetical protein